MAIGIVGCGYWGPNLARAFENTSGAIVSALCDSDETRLTSLQERHPAARRYTEFRQMLEDPNLDAVVIATPASLHYRQAREALLSGKHVLIEKPMAGSSVECEDLISMAEKSGLIIMVDHTYLHSPAVLKIAELVSSGEIGELKYINCQRLNLGIIQNEFNVAWDLAPHDLSVIIHVMEEVPLVVNCQGGSQMGNGIEDVVNISLGFSRGRFATIQNSWIEPRKVRQMTFVGTQKMIVFDDLKAIEKIKIHDVRVERPPRYKDFTQFQYSYHYGDCYIPRVEQREPLCVVCEDFVQSIRGNVAPSSCGRCGLEVVRILEACSESLRLNGAAVKICQSRMSPDRSNALAVEKSLIELNA
ncbi:Gfo/Idh/MocA family protein [Luteolibacter marinus]|uniref:Gfo/Idh/MocA family protein n=1 Tax=Luteolibacter marinus TaxID=2776705 RepID=UPI001D0093E3|nr:Gfo/Idh/MocA family oxidoreductase [Luteolibacter marinus]